MIWLAIEILFGKEVCRMMAMLYATYVANGDKTFAECPRRLKPAIKEILMRDFGMKEEDIEAP